MAKITVDGIVYEANPANNLLQECLTQGLDLPYFCWHPCMGSVGACRQCAVKQYRDADDKKGTVVMACMTPANDGSIISIKDAQATKFRANVIESLMISHPHDCPVCEEGGECHLQDMTQMSGHNYRRYDFKKVTHRNQYLGPFINHEMNRCITCYRCVRFYNDYAGGTDLAALAAHHHVYFGRHEDGVLENEFSGNLVEVCPTGVFTDKTFSQHYTRKWDLQTAPSICTGCGVGCNTTPGERESSLRRIVNRYHHDLNGYFLCDRGRYGYDYSNSNERITTALVRSGGSVGDPGQKLTAQEAKRQLEALISGVVIGIGSPRASLESNFALRERVGKENFYAGFADSQYQCIRAVMNLYREPGLHCPDVRTLEQSDCVLVVGEDITNTAPRLALAVRQATRNAALSMAQQNRMPLWQDAAVRSLAQHTRSPLFILHNQATRLDDVASALFLGSVEEQIDLLAAIAAVLDPTQQSTAVNQQMGVMAHAIAGALRSAQRPAIVSGVSTESEALVQAVANIARILHRLETPATQDTTALCFALPEVNSMGLALLLEEGGGTLGAALQRMTAGATDAVIVLENNLLLRAPHADIDRALAGSASYRCAVIVIDQLHNQFNAKANLLLPVTSFAEQNSTWVNYEGRAQSSYQVFKARDEQHQASDWLAENELLLTTNSTQILHDCILAIPAFAALTGLQPLLDPALAGMKVPRQSPRSSGRTALRAAGNVSEAQQAQDNESRFAFSMEGIPSARDASLLAAAWSPGWNSNQAISKFQAEINGELKQGCKGVHLLHPVTSSSPAITPAKTDTNSSTKRQDAPFKIFFIDHIFGSDELSASAAAIRSRCSGAYLCIGAGDAQKLGLEQYGMAQISCGTQTLSLPVLIRTRIAAGVIGIYCAGEIDRYALGQSAHVSALPPSGDLIASSRQMFAELQIPDRIAEGRPS